MVINFIKCLGLLLLYSLVSKLSHAHNIIELTAGLSKPPFVIENDPKNSGIQLDLIKAIFAEEN